MASVPPPRRTSTQQLAKDVPGPALKLGQNSMSRPAHGLSRDSISTIVEPLQVDFPQSALTDTRSDMAAQVVQPQIFDPQKYWALYPWQPNQRHADAQTPPPPLIAGSSLSPDVISNDFNSNNFNSAEFNSTNFTNAWNDPRTACNLGPPYENVTWQPASAKSYRCWQHGCDGRSFSSLSNYRRHLRERLGPRARCPRCGQAFVRAAARDEHHRERKCTIIQLDANCVPFRTKMIN